MDDFNDLNNLLQQPKRRKARFELVPMVDVIILLFITFALFSATLVAVGSLESKLPAVSCCPGPVLKVDPMVLQASSDNGVYVDRELYDISEVSTLLSEYKRVCNLIGEKPRVIVSGDDKARYSLLVTLIDKAKSADIEQVVIETAYRRSGE